MFDQNFADMRLVCGENYFDSWIRKNGKHLMSYLDEVKI